jgi:hypothetical protein
VNHSASARVDEASRVNGMTLIIWLLRGSMHASDRLPSVNTEGVGLALTLLRLNHIIILETEQKFCISALH